MGARPAIGLFNALKLSVLGFLYLSTLSASSAEVLFNAGTRFIYEAEKAAEPLLVRNLSDKRYLLHSFLIDPATERPSDDFIVLPEVLELAPNEARTLTVRRLGGHFPADRESRLALIGHFIPAADNAKTTADEEAGHTGHLSLAIAVEEKFFVRPAALRLPDAIETAAPLLKVRLTDRGLLLTNPTPYFLSFERVTINGLALTRTVSGKDLDMVEPLSTLLIKVPAETVKEKAHTVTFRLINDAGYPTADFVRTLTKPQAERAE